MTEQTVDFTETIPESCHGLRLDQALATLLSDYSRSQLKSWIQQGFVKVNDTVITQPRQKVSAGQVVVIHALMRDQQNWSGQALPLNIVHEDNDIIIINKPANCVVHPGAGNPDHTLVNALLHHAPELQNVPRGGIVHRLDKDTTGLLVIARNLKAHNHLVQAIQQREIKREYQAIVYGEMITGGTVDAAMGRHPKQRTKMCVRHDGKTARTHYRVIKKYSHFTHCHIILDTGRTHQIRVHMAHIHYPLVGDPVYASKNRISKKWPEALQQTLHHFNRQALHAIQLSLPHPCSGEPLSFTAELPDDMQHLLEQL